MVDIIQPLDFLGRMGGMANMPNLIGDAAGVTAQRDQQAATIDALRARAMNEQAQAAQAQQQQVRAQQFQDALHAHFQDGSPQSASRLMLQFPEYAKQMKDAHDLEDASVREADTLFKSSVYARANAGDWKSAAGVIQKRIDAGKAAGVDVTDEQNLYDHLVSGDPIQQKMALGTLSYDLATAVGPDKWASFAGSDKPTVIGQGGVAIDKDGKVLYENVNEGHAVRVKGQPDQWGNATPDTWVNSVTGELMEGPGAPAAGGAVAGSPATGSRAARNNNPGNIRVSEWTKKQPGFTGEDGGFATFATPADGAAAMTALLGNYLANGKNTIGAIISKWAPASDGNNVNAYVSAVSKATGIPAGKPLTPDDLPAVQQAMAQVEGGGPRGASAAPAGGQGPFGMPADATGEVALAAIPKQYQARVQQLLNGEGAPIRITARSSPVERQIAYALPMIDPTYSDATFQQRAAMRKDVFSGVTSKNIKSINTLMGHLGTLADLAEKRKAADLRYGNKIGGWFATQAGKDYVTNMKLAQQAVADEMENAFTGGGGGTEAGRMGWKDSFSPDSSPAQIRGAIATALHLTGSRITAIKDLWRAGMGPKTPDLQILSPSAAAAYNRIAATSGPPPEVVAALARAGLK